MDENKPTRNVAPALLLMVFAPLLTEVLPGATRFSSIFVFPIEVCVWGGGALLIRDAIRRWQLGWFNMLLLALALSIAEEFLIQQTSIAPMVLQLKGVTYARAGGVNYVYLLWALLYEPLFVVFVPVYLVELIFPAHNKNVWMSKGGFIAVVIFFIIGCFLAWYSWTQIARPTVFHVPAYNPDIIKLAIAVLSIGILIFLALGPIKNKLTTISQSLDPVVEWVPGVIGGLWATVLYGIVVLAFGLVPTFPSAIAVGIGIVLALSALYVVPRWVNSSKWNSKYIYSIIFGTMLGAMLVSFIGFIGSTPIDLYFKILVNLIAVVLMILFGIKRLVR